MLQETFAYLLGRFPGPACRQARFELTAAMTTFLYPVVKHLAIAARNKSRPFTSDELMLQAIAAPEAAEPDRCRAELAAVLKVLPEQQREVLLMRFADAMSLNEIADALAIPLGTVKSRLHNALETLRGDPRTRKYFVE